MKSILVMAIFFFTGAIYATGNQPISPADQLLNMTDIQWQNLEKSLASNELASSFIEEKCFDAETKMLHDRYAVSFDAEGKLCRVYDLTFPHLRMLFKNKAKKSITSIPTQKFKVKDFVNWVDGKYEKVYQQVESFQAQDINLKHKDVASWIKRVRFKKGTAALESFANSNEMPLSFYASDVNLGKKLKFSKYRKNQLRRILNELAKANSGLADYEQWGEIIENPQSLLKKIRFDWNHVKKVYDIAIEGQFLPIKGPIALVNFDRPHKIFVEGILRRVVQIAVAQVFKVIKGPTGRVIGFALNEAFVSIDNAYSYQLNRLESSFVASLTEDSLVLTSQDAKRGLNHVYLGQVDLISEAILRMVQGQKFPWSKLESMGRKQHYQTEKARDVMMDSSNNFLVKKKGCTSEFKYIYFANCQKEASTKLHTLISQFNIYSYNFGPTEIFNYAKPKSVLTKRAVSYLLSIGLSVAQTSIPNWITSNLSKFLREFAFSGIQEEAYLLSQLSLKQSGVGLTPAEKPLLDVLYLQNLNIFTPKSANHEKKIIMANKKLLGLK